MSQLKIGTCALLTLPSRSTRRRTDHRIASRVESLTGKPDTRQHLLPACYTDRSRDAPTTGDVPDVWRSINASLFARPCTRACPRWREIQQALVPATHPKGTEQDKSLIMNQVDTIRFPNVVSQHFARHARHRKFSTARLLVDYTIAIDLEGGVDRRHETMQSLVSDGRSEISGVRNAKSQVAETFRQTDFSGYSKAHGE